MNSTTDTAHQAWNATWADEAGRARWLRPEADVAVLAERVRDARAGRTALDLGCGVGRHALMLAKLGYETTAIDMAENGLAQLQSAAAAAGVSVHTLLAPMTALPVPDETFDFVVAYNVIYHGDPAIVAATVAEIRRVLRPGGVYYGTMLSKRSPALAQGVEIAPSTFVWRDREEEKTHPHFFCNAAEIVALFAGFELSYLEDRINDRSPENRHWHLVAERT